MKKYILIITAIISSFLLGSYYTNHNKITDTEPTSLRYNDINFKDEGLFLFGNYPDAYNIYFDTEKYKVFEFPWYAEYRQVKFRISALGLPIGSILPQIYEKLTGVVLILLNEDGFEISRKDIGEIKNGWITGDIEMKDSDYKSIAKAVLFTDQDT